MKYFLKIGIIFFLLQLTVLVVFAQENLPLTSKEYLYVARIYNSLKIPCQLEEDTVQLQVLDEFGELGYAIAMSSTTQKKIKIDYSVIKEIFQQFKDTAKVDAIVAYILGHEFAHYLHKDGENGFACALNSRNKVSITQQDSLHKIELTRDKEGHFYARLAGFKPNQMMETYFNTVYRKVAGNNSTYPSDTKRLSEIKSTYKTADSLYHIFEAANYLCLFGYYEEAATAYEYLIKHFPSKEMYYNAACAYLIEVNKSGIVRGRKFSIALPLEMNTTLRGGKDISAKKMKAILAKTETFLQKAENLQRDNSAVALAQLYTHFFIEISQNQFDLNLNLDKANVILNSSMNNNASFKALIENFLGIVYFVGNDAEKSKLHFVQAQSLGLEVAENNIKVLEGKDGSKTSSNQLNEDNFLFSAYPNKDENKLLKTPDFTLQYQQVENPKGEVFFLSQEGNELIEIEMYQDTPTKRSIKKGDSIGEVKEKYGNLYTTIFTTEGKIFLYEEFYLAFIFDKNDKLVAWLHYR